MADARNPALETLFAPFDTALSPEGSVLFLNARAHDMLEIFNPASLTLQQSFKPYETALVAAGYRAVPEASVQAGTCDLVLLSAPKSQVETLYLMAQGLEALKEGGMLVVAADNKAGGGRLNKNFALFGFTDICSDARNKARVVWAQKDVVDAGQVQEALRAGAKQSVCEGAFLSVPGLYGWNKIDTGSALLVRELPDNLSGNGADFGCGYGYLAKHVLQHCAGVQALHCLDADWRAVQVCRENVAGSADAFLDFHWEDLRQKPPLQDLDFIVMNPPFHEGKAADTAIGAAFIASAALALKTGGVLWMVANKQLPYEAVLQKHFSDVKKPCEEQGFKIFCATR